MLKLITLLFYFSFLIGCAEIELKTLSEDVKKVFTQSVVTESDIIKAFKEVLLTSTTKSVLALSSENGFLNDKDVAIPFPSEAKKLEKTLRKLGFSSLCDNFYNSMNLAAEKAVDQAAPLFIDAIKNITFVEATKLLKGNDTAITDFLKNKTSRPLVSKFEPIIASYLEKNEATQSWNKLITKYNKLPLVKPVQSNLSYHVTEKTIEGLFLYISRQEASVRNNPKDRTTALIQKVFSQAD